MCVIFYYFCFSYLILTCMRGFFYEKPSSRLSDDLSMIDHTSYLCICINSMQTTYNVKLKIVAKERERPETE